MLGRRCAQTARQFTFRMYHPVYILHIFAVLLVENFMDGEVEGVFSEYFDVP